jgi:hypothetical protein
MRLPFPLFEQSIQEKKIYIFRKNSPFGIDEHMHICLKKPDGNVLYFVCCTTKHKTIEKFLQKQNISYSTIVHIKKDNKNCFDDNDTYINCNTIHTGNLQTFFKAYNNYTIDLIGEISDNHFYQIIKGIMDSPIVTNEIKKALSEFSE